MSGVGEPEEAENYDVGAESEDMYRSRYGVGWEDLLGFVFEVSNTLSSTHRYEPVVYMVCDEDPSMESDQETAAPAMTTSTQENQ